MLGGAARTGTLLNLGYGRREITCAVSEHRLTRIARGLYAVPGVDRAHLEATRLGASLTCVSALSLYGVALVHTPRATHLEVPGNFAARGRNSASIRLHYSRVCADVADPYRLAPVAHALVVASACLSRHEHLVALDSALHLGLLRPDQIAPTPADGAGAVASPCLARTRREWLVAHADARAESPIETLARVGLAEAGLAVHPQRFIDGVGRVDLVVEGKIVVETDGRQHHDDPRAFQRDRERDRRLVRQGFRVLRFTYADLLGPRPVNVGQEVRAALAAFRA